MGVITGYRLADYLLQHTQAERDPICPPATFWDSCITHLTDPQDLENLGHRAAYRMRYRYVIPLLRRAVGGPEEPIEIRSWSTAGRLAWILIDQGNLDEGRAMMLPILYNLVDRGLPEADTRLIAALVELGRGKEALRLARFGLTADGQIESPPAQRPG